MRDLKTLKADELKQLAEDNGVDLSGAKNNSERIVALNNAGITEAEDLPVVDEPTQSTGNGAIKGLSFFQKAAKKQEEAQKRRLDKSNYQEVIENVTVIITKVGSVRDKATSIGTIDMIKLQAEEQYSGTKLKVTLNTNDEWLSKRFEGARVGQAVTGVTLGILKDDVYLKQCVKFIEDNKEANAAKGIVMTMEDVEGIINQIQIIDSQTFDSVEDARNHMSEQRIRKNPLAAVLGMQQKTPTATQSSMQKIMRGYGV
jgi:hypothetical protein